MAASSSELYVLLREDLMPRPLSDNIVNMEKWGVVCPSGWRRREVRVRQRAAKMRDEWLVRPRDILADQLRLILHLLRQRSNIPYPHHGSDHPVSR